VIKAQVQFVLRDAHVPLAQRSHCQAHFEIVLLLRSIKSARVRKNGTSAAVSAPRSTKTFTIFGLLTPVLSVNHAAHDTHLQMALFTSAPALRCRHPIKVN
jgi:hypothetical protein